MNQSVELVISVIALGCSIYAVLLTQSHNRLAMLPHLECHTDRLRANDGITFTLRNTGVGPATIQDRGFLLDGKRYETNLADPVPELAELCLRGKAPFVLKRHGSPSVGSILPAGQSVIIAELFIPGLKPEQEVAVEHLLGFNPAGDTWSGKFRGTLPVAARGIVPRHCHYCSLENP